MYVRYTEEYFSYLYCEPIITAFWSKMLWWMDDKPDKSDTVSTHPWPYQTFDKHASPGLSQDCWEATGLEIWSRIRHCSSSMVLRARHSAARVNLKLVPCFQLHKEYRTCTWREIHLCILLPKIVEVEHNFSRLLWKSKRVIFFLVQGVHRQFTHLWITCEISLFRLVTVCWSWRWNR